MRRSHFTRPTYGYSNRRRRRSQAPRVLLACAALALGTWYFWPHNNSATQRADLSAGQSGADRAAAEPPTARPAGIDWTGGLVNAPAEDRAGLLVALAPQESTTRTTTQAVAAGENPDIAAARRSYEAGQIIEARHQLNAFLVRADLAPAELADVRELLSTIANETLFSKRQLPDDPLADSYMIKSGDRLIHIAPQFDTPFEIIMQINGIRSPERIQQNQKLKVLRGPFHVRIYKSQCRLDLYLQDLYVRSYRVAVGAPDKPTPEGVWKVSNKLPNPTYHPPPTADVHEIIAADDPRNPLGEHWLGLDGIEGEALGRTGFGIHGTIEPDSIGRPVSDGCIRMHNEDVAFIYSVLVSGKSRVTVLP